MTIIERKLKEVLEIIKKEGLGGEDMRELRRENEALRDRIDELTGEDDEEEDVNPEVEELEEKIEVLEEKIEELEDKIRELKGELKEVEDWRSEEVYEIYEKYPDEVLKLLNTHFYYSNGVVLLLSQLETSA